MTPADLLAGFYLVRCVGVDGADVPGTAVGSRGPWWTRPGPGVLLESALLSVSDNKEILLNVSVVHLLQATTDRPAPRPGKTSTAGAPWWPKVLSQQHQVWFEGSELLLLP